MTSPLNNTGPTSNISDVLGQKPATTPKPNNAMGQDAFLKLLVAQLRYQDPSNPANGTEFVAQTAQFTQVEKLGQLAEDQRQLVATQLRLAAGNLVGRTITYPGPDGTDITGVVESATLLGSDPTLRVGHTDVPLSSVKEVHRST
jgi:flagellar basal-body rod modification protein FlgD